MVSSAANCKAFRRCAQAPNCFVSTFVECQFGCRSFRRGRKLGNLHWFRVDPNVDLLQAWWTSRAISLPAEHASSHDPAYLRSLRHSGLQQHYMAVAKQANKPGSNRIIWCKMPREFWAAEELSSKLSWWDCRPSSGSVLHFLTELLKGNSCTIILSFPPTLS